MILNSCGYKLSSSNATHSVSVPYVKGDQEGLFTSSLISAIATEGRYDITGSNADYLLEIELDDKGSKNIGWEYDVVGTKAFKRLVSNEARRTAIAKVTLIDQKTGKKIHDKIKVSATSDYDFVDPVTARQNAMPSGQSVLSFSLGQLDSVDGAAIGAKTPLYKSLAQLIAQSL